MHKLPSVVRLITLTVMALACVGAVQAIDAATRHDVSVPPCSDCHQCESPTLAEPCLKNCLNPDEVQRATHSAGEGPGVSVFGDSRDLYQPVQFNHKLHAEMVGMGEGCTTCHHYSPEGKFPPCRECHENPGSLGQPGLKGAFHRQCMGCHREWSHETKCIECHLPCAPAEWMNAPHDSTDIAGAKHPLVNVPAKKVYHTPYDKGEVVTFYHNEHVDRFELQCANCHKRENCSYCHHMPDTKTVVKTDEEIHAICDDCHEKDECSNCHGNEEKPPFAHSTLEWQLGEHHTELECRNCHPTGKRISTMNGNCNHCHAGWNTDNFRHAATGLMLDETHVDFDCVDCHLDRKFHKEPDCADCHDDARSAKNSLPGKRVNLIGKLGSSH